MTICNISSFVIKPSPSKSYSLKAHSSLSSALPREVMDNAEINCQLESATEQTVTPTTSVKSSKTKPGKVQVFVNGGEETY